MRKILFPLFIIPFFFISYVSQATIVTTNGTGGGNWDSPDTWVPGGVPDCSDDTLNILAGDTIIIDSQQDYSGCCCRIVIFLHGVILFPDNGPMLRLPCGAGIIGFPDGEISAPGSDHGNKIFICEEIVFDSGDDDMSGPFLLAPRPLPVKLQSFEAEIDNTSVKFTWKTSAEINNDFFTIERSKNGLDFELLGEVPGSGNSNTIKEYNYFDDSPIQGTSYYRLKQTDFDGKFEYVDLIAVNFNQDDDGICTLHVYPNPCVGSCTINLKDCPLADSQVDVELYDAFGKKITNRITPKSKDQGISFHLNSANNLAPGVYIVRASANGKNQASKVVVK